MDVCWIKRRPGDLALHSFETDSDFVGAHFIPGGEFVIVLYAIGDVALNKIERSMKVSTGGLDLREIQDTKSRPRIMAHSVVGSSRGRLTDALCLYGQGPLSITGAVGKSKLHNDGRLVYCRHRC